MIGITDLAVLGLAAYRATRIAVHDTITDSLRSPIYDWHARRGSRTSSAAVTLISCTYCAGWWISGAVLATWLHETRTWHGTPLLVHGLEWFAVAGCAALLNHWDDVTGDGS